MMYPQKSMNCTYRCVSQMPILQLNFNVNTARTFIHTSIQVAVHYVTNSFPHPSSQKLGVTLQ